MPNPNRGQGRVEYETASGGPVTITLHDIAGREVERLASGPHATGRYVARFGQPGQASLRPGVYLIRLATADRVLGRRMIVAP